MTYRNSALLMRVADHIEQHPDTYDQRTWIQGDIVYEINNRQGSEASSVIVACKVADKIAHMDIDQCGTTACVAGWTVLLGAADVDPYSSGYIADQAAELLFNDPYDEMSSWLFNESRNADTMPFVLRLLAGGASLTQCEAIDDHAHDMRNAQRHVEELRAELAWQDERRLAANRRSDSFAEAHEASQAELQQALANAAEGWANADRLTGEVRDDHFTILNLRSMNQRLQTQNDTQARTIRQDAAVLANTITERDEYRNVLDNIKATVDVELRYCTINANAIVRDLAQVQATLNGITV